VARLAGVARLADVGYPVRGRAPGPGWRARSAPRHPAWSDAVIRGRSGDGGAQEKWPPRALAVAETRPQGPTGRVGAGL